MKTRTSYISRRVFSAIVAIMLIAMKCEADSAVVNGLRWTYIRSLGGKGVSLGNSRFSTAIPT